MATDLGEIRAALAAATPGPWVVDPMEQVVRAADRTILFDGSDTLELEECSGDEYGVGEMFEPGTSHADCWHSAIPDAHLIANAPAWLDQLCDWVDRAEASRSVIQAERYRLALIVDRIAEALVEVPTACEVHPSDDPVPCGWKHVVADVQRALAGEASA